MRSDAERLRDIVESIGKIEEQAPRGREAFERDELIQVWMIHHIEIIGEAARSVSETVRQGHPEIPWAHIVAMRNVLTHDYFGIDKREVWSVVENDLPDLKRKVGAILTELGEGDGASQEMP